MSARLHLTRDMLRAGTHLLITDIDNVFSRHVPLRGFLEEGYDAFHAFEMRYPEEIYDEVGLVVCSGHQFLRSSPGGLRFIDQVLAFCTRAKCDDQVVYNRVIFRQLDVRWDGMDRPDRPGALRVNSTIEENDTLLVESVTGRSRVTNHTIKIWDRDFAWRVSVFVGAMRGAVESPGASAFSLALFLVSLAYHRCTSSVGSWDSRTLSLDE